MRDGHVQEAQARVVRGGRRGEGEEKRRGDEAAACSERSRRAQLTLHGWEWVRPFCGVDSYGNTLLNAMSLALTLSPAGPRTIGGLTRRSLMSAVTAMSRTSSPNRRPFGQPPGTTPPPKPACTWLTRVSPPKMLRRENPASSGLVRCMLPPPASRAGSVDRSTLM